MAGRYREYLVTSYHSLLSNPTFFCNVLRNQRHLCHHDARHRLINMSWDQQPSRLVDTTPCTIHILEISKRSKQCYHPNAIVTTKSDFIPSQEENCAIMTSFFRFAHQILHFVCSTFLPSKSLSTSDEPTSLNLCIHTEPLEDSFRHLCHHPRPHISKSDIF